MRALRSSSLLASLLAASTLTVACDDGGTGGKTGDPTEATTATTTPTTTTEADTTEPEPDVPVVEEDDYPAGPYGAEYLDIIRGDIGFFDPISGQNTFIKDFYKSPDTKVLMIISGAGWCTACSYESWDLVDTYNKFHEDGLEVLYTLYEDQNAEPIFQPDATEEEFEKNWIFFNQWKDNLGALVNLEPTRVANYSVLVDIPFALGEYYDQNATPMSLIIRTSDMQIQYRQIGYDPGSVETIVKSVLYAHP